MTAHSCVICATPRTGSSLLCGLLASTGVAGIPESYFRREDEGAWAQRWGLPARAGVRDFGDFVRHALAAGHTANGVFGVRIMWGTMDELVAKLRAPSEDDASTDLDVLTRTCGPTHFIHLRRADVLAQAVSWSRAEQTGVWFEEVDAPGDAPAARPDFDRNAISDLIQTIEEHNQAWRDWFDANGIDAYDVRYEDLAADPVATTQRVLDFLELRLPAGRTIEVRHRRLADELSTEWMSTYRRATGTGRS